MGVGLGGRGGGIGAWPGGADECRRGSGQRRPSTQKDGLAKVAALTLAELKGRPALVAACEDATLRVFPVDAGGKVSDRAQLFHGAMTWAEYELKRRDPKLREVSLRALAAWNDAKSLELLANRVSQDDDHGLKVLATELLGASGSPRAVKLLEPLLQAGEENVRLAALAGLRKLEGQDSLRILDLALAAGWPSTPFYADPVRIWRNDDPASPWPDRAGALGVVFARQGRGLVPLDYDRDGDLDLNILIRSGEVERDASGGSVLRFRTGAGIVADSDPQRELDETRAKAAAVLAAIAASHGTSLQALSAQQEQHKDVSHD